MALSIVIVASGGLPITEAANGYGTPVSIAANGYGTPCTIVASGGLPVVGSTLPTTFNPTNKNAAITLSNGNLSAASGSTGYQTVFATASKSAGKYYYEVIFGGTGGTGNDFVGVGNGSVALNDYPGDGNTNGASLLTGFGGIIFYNGNTAIGCGTVSDGTAAGVAIDIDNELAWFRTGAGNWNGSATANPATGVGGVSISAMTAPIFPIVSLGNQNRTVTANFGATAYANAAPVGFGNVT